MSNACMPTLLIEPAAAGRRAGGARFLAVARPVDERFARDGGPCLVLAPHPTLDRESLARRYRLTPQQVTVAELLWHRRTNDEIAQILSIAKNTTRRHVEAVLFRLGLRNRWEVESALNELLVSEEFA
jgi:DNA-binding NarL/FixJ family response regulator